VNPFVEIGQVTRLQMGGGSRGQALRRDSISAVYSASTERLRITSTAPHSSMQQRGVRSGPRTTCRSPWASGYHCGAKAGASILSCRNPESEGGDRGLDKRSGSLLAIALPCPGLQVGAAREPPPDHPKWLIARFDGVTANQIHRSAMVN
jgi:hypothetical protein